MNGEPPTGPGDESVPGTEPAEEESLSLPPWVPVVIGAALLGMAALAVFTGLRYRARTEESVFSAAAAPVRSGESSGAPGEPQAGASRALHGKAGENIPRPAEPDAEDTSRITITGDVSGVSSTIRASVRRGVIFHIQPVDAAVYVNEQFIGTANQFASGDEAYEFADEGKFTIRFVSPGYHDSVYIITADPEAENEVVTISETMDRKSR